MEVSLCPTLRVHTTIHWPFEIRLMPGCLQNIYAFTTPLLLGVLAGNASRQLTAEPHLKVDNHALTAHVIHQCQPSLSLGSTGGFVSVGTLKNIFIRGDGDT